MAQSTSTSMDQPPPLPSGLDGPVPMMIHQRHALSDAPDRVPSLPMVPGTDKFAIASAVCGLTAFIPVLSQLVGLVLGIFALVRIRRGRRMGRIIHGNGWATAGIGWNGFVLLGWIALLGAFSTLQSSLSHTNNSFRRLLQTPALSRPHVRK